MQKNLLKPIKEHPSGAALIYFLTTYPVYLALGSLALAGLVISKLWQARLAQVIATDKKVCLSKKNDKAVTKKNR